MSAKGGDDNRSPWTRSCERKRVEGVVGAKSNNLGINMQGRILFKQSKTNQQVAREQVNKMVRIDRMKSLEYEREILATDEQGVGRRDDGGKDVVIGAGDGMQRVTHEVVDGVGVKGKDSGNVVRDAGNAVEGVTELENALKCMADLELKNKASEGTISKLEAEVVSLKSKMEMQAVNIVGGFGCVVKVKDDEIRKLETENKELRQTISMLEDQLADQQVHTVTQAYRMNTPTGVRDVGASNCEGGSGFGVTVVHDVTPIRVGLNVGIGGDNVTVHTVSDSSPVPDRSVGNENLSDLEVGLFPNKGEVIRNSFVRNLKNKVRKELRLKDYDYQVVGEQEKKKLAYGCKAVGVRKGTVNDAVVDVDTVGVAASKWSGFDLNNRFGVWKMMTYEEKEKIMKAYERNGDGAVMWASGESGVVVYFTDIKSLVRGESICGNVIDAYAETLVTEQAHVCADDVLADKSYFFSSICMSVFNRNNQTMESYVLKNFAASKECRYIHFPICNNAHWTLVVYDAEDGSWKHFNPMRQRLAGRSDVHYKEALVLKERVSAVMKRSLREDGIDEVSIAETFNHPLEAVEDCPQQKADSLDCAVIVCAVMRQYVHHVDVARSLQGTNGIVLRANMVKGFVNDISRGLKHSN
ncbi:hypothetical protein LOK49_LG07G02831 [Camellia lanceoleosa]|uniref:Uncharacterized protein n=1 Tax=Camellia lanceoleosa TaxID=1840588 RepID=A0ACC0H8W1_9ERIC|nr:hypothetical protein LOK49_LG07G02831 [Camellia lanceoleosa]